MRHLVLLLCIIPTLLFANKDNTRAIQQIFSDCIGQDSLSFPASWQGVWTGTLEIRNAKGLAQTLPMELHISPIENSQSYTWWIIYGEDKIKGKRAYELQTVDKDKGIYVVDEKNTIKLESYLIGEKLISYYSVEGTVIIVTNDRRGDEMIFEIIAGSDIPVSVTGGMMHEGEDIPEVKTFPIKVQQKAILRRQ